LTNGLHVENIYIYVYRLFESYMTNVTCDVAPCPGRELEFPALILLTAADEITKGSSGALEPGVFSTARI
jgi:hypothetical protein